MDTQEALRILIQNSALMDDQKDELLTALPDMSPQDQHALGVTLANQRKQEAQQAKEIVEKLDSILAAQEDPEA